jgi:hypothetical protein
MASGRSKDKDGFTIVEPGGLGKTLATKLIPVADKIRDLHTVFGGRVYTVSIYRTRWSGGSRGLGDETIIFKQDIRPTPRITDLGTLTQILNPTGLDESGTIQLSEISGRFTEDSLLGIDTEGREPLESDHVFYEIEFVGRPSVRRRFGLRSAPNYKPYQFQWFITLQKLDEDRARDGSLR